jgi:eukaryotic-like serine/threonine-protein kinase
VPTAGEMFNHYKVIETIGKGGMGEVFLAEDTVLERKVAIKFLPENVNSDPHTRKRFLREAKAAAALNHPNICQVYETAEAQSRAFIVMEFVDGETLKQRLDRGPLPLMETVQLACELAEALTEAHAKGIVHRDLKPANIMLKAQGRPKIMDFGLAKQVEPVGGADNEQKLNSIHVIQRPSANNTAETLGPNAMDRGLLQALNAVDISTISKLPSKSNDQALTENGFPISNAAAGETVSNSGDLTQEGALVGTIAYMSPEQARCQQVDARSDIFSFAVVLYEMLSGRNPFHRESQIQTLSAIIRDSAPPPQTQSASAPPAAMRNILSKALAKDPSKRYQSIKEMEQDLRAVRDDLQPRKRPVWVSWTLSAAGVLVIALIAISLWFANRAPSPKEHPPLPVLIADFDNNTGEAVFDAVLEQALEVGLEEASFISSYKRASARTIAQKINPGAVRMSRDTARLVAQREGIPIVLAGSVAKAGSEYRLSVEAVDSVSGKVGAKRQVAAKNKEDVFAKMANLAVRIRRDLGDTEAESAKLIEKETFTSSSIEAAQSYAVAQNLLGGSGKWREALGPFLRAIQLDPNFGRAYAGLAVCYRNLGQSQESEKYYQEAMKHIDRMTDREKYRTRGGYYIWKKNYAQAIEQYEALIKQYPADRVGLSNLALAYFYGRDVASALKQQRKALEIWPSSLPVRGNLALYAMYAGEFDAAGAEAAKVIGMDATYWTAYVCRAVSETAKGHLPQAREIYQKLATVNSDGASISVVGLADLAAYEGKFTDSISILEKGIAVDVANKNSGDAARKLAALADARLHLGQKPLAITAAEKAVVASKDDQILFEAASVYVKADRIPEALDLAKALKERLEPDPQAYANLIQAKVQLLKGDRVEAIRLLETTLKSLNLWIGRFELGLAYLEAGAFPEASSQFEQCMKRRGEAMALFLDDAPTMRYLPPIYYYLGRAQEGQGAPNAADSYRTFLSIKTGSEKDPLVSDAQQRLAAVK